MTFHRNSQSSYKILDLLSLGASERAREVRLWNVLPSKKWPKMCLQFSFDYSYCRKTVKMVMRTLNKMFITCKEDGTSHTLNCCIVSELSCIKEGSIQDKADHPSHWWSAIPNKNCPESQSWAKRGPGKRHLLHFLLQISAAGLSRAVLHWSAPRSLSATSLSVFLCVSLPLSLCLCLCVCLSVSRCMTLAF